MYKGCTKTEEILRLPNIKPPGKVDPRYVTRHEKNELRVRKYIIKICPILLLVLFVGVILPYHSMFSNFVELFFSCYIRNQFLTLMAFKFVLL